MRRLAALLAPVAAAALLVAGCVPEPPPGSTTTTSTAPRHVMSVGHADIFEVTVSGSALRVQIEDESGPSVVYRDPARTLLHVRPTAQTSVPNPPGAFSFLGAGGAPVWVLPQIQDAALLWPGTSTDRIPTGTLQGDRVTWTVDSVSGPGGFHVFTNGAFGAPGVVVSTQSGFPQSRQLTVPSHAHYNWAFGATGTYTVVMRATATLAGGTPVTSGPLTYTFRVGAL